MVIFKLFFVFLGLFCENILVIALGRMFKFTFMLFGDKVVLFVLVLVYCIVW